MRFERTLKVSKKDIKMRPNILTRSKRNKS